MLIHLFVLSIIVCLLYYYFTKVFSYWKNKNVKGPKPIPVFGNFLQVVLRRKPKVMLYGDIYNQYPEEKVVGFYQMASPTLLVRDLDIVKQIMIKEFEHFPDRATYFTKEGLGQNIFHCDYETWKFLRNRFTSLFTSGKVKNVFHLLLDRSDKFVDYIDNVTTVQPEQDIYKLVFKFTLTTSMAVLFNWDIDTFNESTEFFETVDKNLNNSLLNELNMLFPGILNKLNLTILSDKARNICYQILEACLDRETISDNSNILILRDLIISLKNESNINHKQLKDEEADLKVTDDLLAAQIWVFYTAGYLNNALTISYAMYHLARNPGIQDRLRKEIDDVMEEHDGKITYESLKGMKYLEMVMKETLRINPLAHGLVRSVNQDVKIEGTDLTIDKGSVVVVPTYSIHHDEKYYPNPEKFDPDRFLPENVNNRHPCAFLTFGVGRRSCLGTQLTRIQFSICVAKMLHRFRVEITENTCQSIKFDSWHMLLKPEENISLKLIPRKK